LGARKSEIVEVESLAGIRKHTSPHKTFAAVIPQNQQRQLAAVGYLDD